MHSELRRTARHAEDLYFRMKDAELMARARATHLPVASPHRVVDPREEAERRMLGDALCVDDPAIIGPLFEAGLRAATADLIELLPAIEVAWVDDLDMAEREELRRQIMQWHATNPHGMGLVHEWLFLEPPAAVLEAAHRALWHQLHALDAAGRERMLQRILDRCDAVGRASGGLFGFGALSLAERRRIDAIRHEIQPFASV